MRLLVTGSRDWTDRQRVFDVLNRLRPTVIIEGGARGLDTIVSQLAKSWGIPIITFPADWRTYGKAAGSIRNQQMLDEGKPDYVVAFPLPQSKGTWDMVRRARKAGLAIEIINS